MTKSSASKEKKVKRERGGKKKEKKTTRRRRAESSETPPSHEEFVESDPPHPLSIGRTPFHLYYKNPIDELGRRVYDQIHNIMGLTPEQARYANALLRRSERRSNEFHKHVPKRIRRAQ